MSVQIYIRLSITRIADLLLNFPKFSKLNFQDEFPSNLNLLSLVILYCVVSNVDCIPYCHNIILIVGCVSNWY